MAIREVPKAYSLPLTMPPEAAVEMACEILRELRPDLGAAVDALERRRALRVVGSDGPEAA